MANPTSQRIGQLVSEGMSISDAEQQASFELTNPEITNQIANNQPIYAPIHPNITEDVLKKDAPSTYNSFDVPTPNINPVQSKAPTDKRLDVAKAKTNAENNLERISLSTQQEQLFKDILRQEELDKLNTLGMDGYLNDPTSTYTPTEKEQLLSDVVNNELDKKDRDRTRSSTEIAGDALLSIGSGVTQTAAIVPALGALVTGGNYGLDSYRKLQKVSDYLKSKQSSTSQLASENVGEASRAEFLRNKAKALTEGTDDDLAQDITSFLGEVGESAKAAIDNPEAIVDTLFQEIPSLLIGGAIGKQAIKQSLKNTLEKGGREVSEEALQKFGSTRLGKKISEKAGTVAGISTSALEEGAGVSMQAANEVMGMSFEQLAESSELYNQYLIKFDGDKEKAREEVAGDVAVQTMVTGALISGFVSKYSGAGKFEGNIFNRNKSASVLKDAAKEGGEEALQGTVTQGAANKIVQTQANEDKDVREGLGEEAALGGIAGSSLGGTASTAKAITSKGKTKKSKPTTDKPEEPEEEDIEPEVELPESDAEVAKLETELLAKYDENEAKLDAEDISEEDADKLFNENDEIITKIKAITKRKNQQAITPEQSVELAKTATDKNADEDAKVNAQEQIIFRSSQNPEEVSNEALDVLINDSDVSDDVKEHLSNVKETKEAYAALPGSSGKTTAGVSQNILTQSDGDFKSLNEYRENVNEANKTNDRDAINSELGALRRFSANQETKAAAFEVAYNAVKDVKGALSKAELTPEQKKALEGVSKWFSYDVQKDADGKILNNFSKVGQATLGKLAANVELDNRAVNATLNELRTVGNIKQALPGKSKNTKGIRKYVTAPKVKRKLNDIVKELSRDDKRTLYNNFRYDTSLKRSVVGRDWSNAVNSTFLNFVDKSEGKVTDAQLSLFNKIIGEAAAEINETPTEFDQTDVKDFYENKETHRVELDKAAGIFNTKTKKAAAKKPLDVKVKEGPATPKATTKPKVKTKPKVDLTDGLNKVKKLLKDGFGKNLKKGYADLAKRINANEELSKLNENTLNKLINLLENDAPVKEVGAVAEPEPELEVVLKEETPEPEVPVEEAVQLDLILDPETDEVKVTVLPDLGTPDTLTAPTVEAPVNVDDMVTLEEEASNEKPTYKFGELFKKFFGIRKKTKIDKSLLLENPALLDFANDIFIQSIETYIGRKLSKGDRDSIISFKEQALSARETINSNWVNPNALELTEIDSNPLSIMANEDGSLNQQYANTMAITQTLWTGSDIGALAFLDKDSVKSYLGLQDSDHLPGKIYLYFANKGLPAYLLAGGLGKSVLQGLDLTTTKDAPASLQATTESAIGLFLLDSMEAHGLLVKNKVDVNELNEKFPFENNGFLKDKFENVSNIPNTYAANTVFNPVENRNTLHSKIAEDVANIQATMRVASVAFKDSFIGFLPTFIKPTAEDLKLKMSKTDQDISPQQFDAILKMSQEPQTAKRSILKVFNGMSKDNRLKLQGYKTKEEIDALHVDERDTAISINEDILRKDENIQQMLSDLQSEGGLDTEFYFTHNVWKLLRMGMQSRGINPQQSHTDRHLFGNKKTNTDSITLNQANSLRGRGNGKTPINVFLNALALSFDIDVDKQTPKKSRKELFSILNKPEVKKVIGYIQQGTIDEHTDELLAVIGDMSSEPLFALDGLMNASRYLTALEQKPSKANPITFDVDLFYEIDGLTNGPWLSKEQLGTSSDKDTAKSDLEKGGLMFGDEHDSYASKKEAGDISTDYYQDYGKTLLQNFVGGLSNYKNSLFIMHFFDKFFDNINDANSINEQGIRKIGKVGLIPANYGASANAQANNVISYLIESMINHVSSETQGLLTDFEINKGNLINTLNGIGNITNSKEHSALAERLSKLSGKNRSEVEAFIADAMNQTIPTSSNELSGLKQSATQAAEIAISKQQGVILQNRELINLQAKAMVSMYNAVYNSLVKKRLDQRKYEYLEDKLKRKLTNEDVEFIQNKLKSMFPAFHNLFSKANGNINQGTQVAKTESNISGDSEYLVNINTNNNKGTIGTRASKPELVDGGVAPNIANIIGLDATIMAHLVKEVSALNIHDAIAVSISDAAAGADSTINQITYEVLKDFNVLTETSNRFNQVLSQFNAYVENDPSIVASISDFKVSDDLIEFVGMHNPDVDLTTLEGLSQAGTTLAQVNHNNRLNNGMLSSDAKFMSQYSSGFSGHEIDANAPKQIVNLERQKFDKKIESKPKTERKQPTPKEVYEEKVDQVTEKVDVLLETYPDAMNVSNINEAVAIQEYLSMPAVLDFLGNVDANTNLRDYLINGLSLNSDSDQMLADLVTLSEAINSNKLSLRRTNGMQLDAELSSYLKDNGPTHDADSIKSILDIIAGSALPGAALITNKLKSLIRDDVKLHYIQDITDPAIVDNQVVLDVFHNAHGVEYAGDVYIKGDNFILDGSSPRTILHELLHSVTTGIIQSPSNNDEFTAVKELNKLREFFQEATKDRDDLSEYVGAFKNVEEFLVEVFTNPVFQQILKDTPYKNGTFFSKLVRTLSKALGLNPTGEITNGLEYAIFASDVLIEGNVSKAVVDASIFNSSSQNLGNIDYSHLTDVSNKNVVEVFDSLGDIKKDTAPTTKSHSSYLRNLLTNISDKIITPISLLLGDTENSNHGHIDVTNNRLYLAMQAIPSKIRSTRPLVLGSDMSVQEIYVHELLHKITEYGIENSNLLRSQLEKLYKQALAEITVKDFMPNPNMGRNDPGYSEAYDKAQAHYDHVFGTGITSETYTYTNELTGEKETRTRSTHLHEFAAMGATHAPLIRALNNMQHVDTTKVEGLGSALIAWFERVMNHIYEHFTGSKRYTNVTGYARLMDLVAGLSEVEQRQKAALNTAYAKQSQKIEDGVDNVTDKVMGKVGNFGAKLSKSKVRAVSIGGDILNKVANNEMATLFEQIDNYRHTLSEGREGFFGNITSDLVGRVKKNSKLINQFIMGTKAIDKARSHLDKYTQEALLESYTNDLLPEEKSAITKFLLKTDAVSLLDFSNEETITSQVNKLRDYINNPNSIDADIRQLEQQLSAFNPGALNFYTRSAESLGHFMATGKALEQVSMLNAYNIANLNYEHALESHKPSAIDANNAEAIIDKLATLHAMKYTDLSTKAHIKNVMNTEFSKPLNKNGLMFTLATHQKIKVDGLKKNLKGQKALQRKGYIRDLYNPYISVKVGLEADAEKLSRLGYEKVDYIDKDPADKTTHQAVLYKNAHGGAMSRVSGLLSTQNETAFGTGTVELSQQQDGIDNPGLNSDKDYERIHRYKARAAREMFKPKTKVSVPLETSLIPVYDRFGGVSNYRYSMNEATKDAVLERNTEFEQVLGSMAGTVESKVMSIKNNRKAVELLHDDYLENKDKKGFEKRFIEISANSPDKDIREMMYMMPKDTLNHLRKVWGGNTFYVSRENLNLVFGYRKLSVINPWLRSEAERNTLDKAFIGSMEVVFGKKIPAKLRTIEDLTFKLTAMAKDNIVVKSLVVTAANFISNASTLAISGVPILDIAKGHKEAFIFAKKFQDDAKALHKIDLALNNNVHSKNEIKRLTALRNTHQAALDANPIKDMVDAGMLQTIVEDVDTESNKSIFKEKWVKEAQERSDKLLVGVPDNVKDVSKNFFMTQDTSMYEIANSMVHLSDFAARYTLHKHLTTRKRNRKTPLESFEYCMDLFVNYDIPSNSRLQYLNDVGALWFTKYLIRNQRAVSMLVSDNPGRAAAFQLVSGIVGNIDSIMNTVLTPQSVINRIGAGPLSVLGTIDEIAPINMLSNITPG